MLMLFSSCKKEANTDHSKQIKKVSYYLNSKDYENAINILELAEKENSISKELKIKLAHAYAGAAKFEVKTFAHMIDKIQKNNLNSTAYKNLKTLDLVLSNVPNLTNKQKIRLSKAINIYTELSLNPCYASHKNNFKWAILHTYRLLINLKEINNFTKEIIENKNRYTNEEVQAFYIEKGDQLIQDFYKTYILFKKNFPKVQKLAKNFGMLVRDKAKIGDFKLKIQSRANNYQQFIVDVVNDNKEIISAIITKFNKQINLLNLSETIENIKNAVESKQTKIIKAYDRKDEFIEHETSEGLHRSNEKNVKLNLKRLEVITRLFIENVVLGNSKRSEYLKEIFSEELSELFHEALKKSLDEKSLNAINNFFDDNNYSLRLIFETWDILSSEYSTKDLSKTVEAEIKLLINYIDEYELKNLNNRIKSAQKNSKEIIDNNLDVLNRRYNVALDITKNEVHDLVDEKIEDIKSITEDSYITEEEKDDCNF